jgi:hypothetical protein
MITKTYGDFSIFWRFLTTKNKPNQTQFYLAPRISGGLKKQTQFTNG